MDPVGLQVEVPAGDSTFMTSAQLRAVNASLAKEKGLEPPTHPVARAEMKKRIATVTELWRLCNAHEIHFTEALFTADAIVEFCDENKKVGMEMPFHVWAEEMERVDGSFPDIHFRYDRLASNCGVVIMKGFRASGTHTGAPFSCGPCVAIEATGKEVMNDPEEACIFFREGEDKIARMVVCPKGDNTGPAGFYTQIGGFPLM